MRKLFAIALMLVSLFSLAGRGNPPTKPDDKEPVKKDKPLEVGDQPPALFVTRWLQGEESKEYTPGGVYVVDFWATWCDPCIAIMPVTSALQKEYREKGVTCISFTARDEKGNSRDRVNAFVAKRGSKLGYRFAYAEDRRTYDTWITSAKRTIPCSFVVGKDGKIAYIGHPMFLAEVIPKVVAGSWSNDDVERLAKVETEVIAVFNALASSNAEQGLTALGEFQKKHPLLAGIPYFVGPRISLLLKTKKVEEARKAAEDSIAKAIEADDSLMLAKLSTILRSSDIDNRRDLLALSLKAAEASLKIAGDKDMLALWNLAESYYALGKREKAKEYGEKAIAAGDDESPALKKYIQQQIKKFDEEKKDE
jgi:thiol-disulfide isomerase/thioredoxin